MSKNFRAAKKLIKIYKFLQKFTSNVLSFVKNCYVLIKSPKSPFVILD